MVALSIKHCLRSGEIKRNHKTHLCKGWGPGCQGGGRASLGTWLPSSLAVGGVGVARGPPWEVSAAAEGGWWAVTRCASKPSPPRALDYPPSGGELPVSDFWCLQSLFLRVLLVDTHTCGCVTWAVKYKLCHLIHFSETLDRRLQRAEKVFQGRVTCGLLRQASCPRDKDPRARVGSDISRAP